MAESETSDFITKALQHWAVITNMFAVFGLGVAVPAFSWYTKHKMKKKEKRADEFKDIINPIVERIDIYSEIHAEQNEAIIYNLETINKKLDEILRDYKF